MNPSKKGELFEQLLKAAPDDLWQLAEKYIARQTEKSGYSATALLNLAEDVVLFGAGEYARAVLKAWQGKTFFPRYLVDSNPDKWGKFWQGLPVLSPDELSKDARNPLVVIAAMDTHAIEDRLNNLNIVPLYAERDGTVNFISGHGLLNHRESFGLVYEQLADAQSRQAWLSVFKARLFQGFHFPMQGNLFTVECTSHPQYFSSDIIQFTENEAFVDCGAYDGDTLIQFASQMWRRNIKNWRAIAFEADTENRQKVQHNLHEFGLGHIQVIHGAVGVDETAWIHNCRGGLAPADVPHITLNKALEDFAPTFIKMDIEGAELSALRSTTNFITNHRPKLAICIYHQTSDLVEIPLYIQQHFPDYLRYIRHHRCGSLWETVCYAIPKK